MAGVALDLNLEIETHEKIYYTLTSGHSRQRAPEVLSPGKARQEAGGVQWFPQAREAARGDSLEKGSCESS